MSIGECIKEKRIASGYSQDSLAKIVGIRQPMIAQIERGTKIPTMLLGKSIAQALGCKVDDLYGEE
ncbi:MAG: helix-turn-helix transcriptional regulator [Lachnospiraceae bacterium]|nr:helix-turn-helix transcriptional regulator [Lachnospiraceae bacterium]